MNFIQCHLQPSKSQGQCRFKEWKIQPTPGSLVINLPIFLLIIPFYNQVSSFSLCPFHYDMYNFKIKGRQVLECEDTWRSKKVRLSFFFFLINHQLKSGLVRNFSCSILTPLIRESISALYSPGEK